MHSTMRLDQEQALAVARELCALGMPMFLAQPEATGYRLPSGWQTIAPDPAVVDAWRPGMALCAVTGHVLDLIDIDPRSGGTVPEGYLPTPVLAEATSPSGGRHYFVLPLGVRSRDGVWPGVDVKSGLPDGSGRGFAFLAPTVRRSKVDGLHRLYVWEQKPDPGIIRHLQDWTRERGYPAADPIRRRIAELRTERAPDGLPRRIPHSVARAEWDRAYGRLVDDLRHWAATGWGGAAHAGLLAASTHLARLSPEAAPAAFEAAFAAAGVTPDADDLAKLDSAVSAAVPDVVVDDADMPPQELFWAGAQVPGAELDRGGGVPGPREAGPERARAGYEFTPVTRERFRCRTPPAAPTYGLFGRASGLFYASGVHWLQGESESGKSWVALVVMAEVLRSGGTVLYVDYEDTEASVFERLDQLGVTDDEIELMTYVDGHEVLFAELCTHVAEGGYTAMTVDGVTSSCTSAGLSGRDEQELTRWADLLPRRARMAVCVDHVVKAIDDRRGMAVGTQAKKSVVTGSSWEVVCKVKFGRGSQDGAIQLNLQKDKPGGLRGRPGCERVRLRFVSDPTTGAVALGVPGEHQGADGFFGDVSEVRARAIYERLVAWEAAGGAIPPKMTMAVMRRLVRDEMNETGGQHAVDEAIRMFKRAKGLPVSEGTPEDS